jgi:hypothetical protein
MGLRYAAYGAICLLSVVLGVAWYAGAPQAAISGWTLENLPEFADLKLAPDGRHAAALQPVRGSGSVVIYSIGNGAHCVFAPSDVKIRRIEWGNSRRLLVQVSVTRVPQGYERAYEWYRWISLGADCVSPVLMMRDSGEIEVPDPSELLRIQPDTMGVMTSDPIAHMTAKQLEEVARSADLLRVAAREEPDVLMGLCQVDKTSRAGLIAGPASSRAPSSHCDLYAANLDTGLSQRLASGQEDTKAWLVDDQNVARARVDTNAKSGRVSDFARSDDGSGWRQIYAFDLGERGTRGMSFEGLSPGDPNVAYVLARTGSERIDAYEYDLRAGALGRSLVRGPSKGVDRFLRDPLTNRVIGVVYFQPVPPIERFEEKPGENYTVTSQAQPDAPRLEIFDAEWQALYAQVEAGFPGQSAVITSIAADHKTMIVFADGGDDRGGAYYFVDLAQAKSWKAGARFAEASNATLTSVQSTRFHGRDGLLIPAQLVLPGGRNGRGLPLVVLLEGSAEAGSLAFADWRAQVWAHSGYAVLQPQFRGPDGLGSSMARRLSEPLLADVHGAVTQLIERGLVDRQRVCFSTNVGARGSAREDFSAAAPGDIRDRSRLSLCQSFAAY